MGPLTWTWRNKSDEWVAGPKTDPERSGELRRAMAAALRKFAGAWGSFGLTVGVGVGTSVYCYYDLTALLKKRADAGRLLFEPRPKAKAPKVEVRRGSVSRARALDLLVTLFRAPCQPVYGGVASVQESMLYTRVRVLASRARQKGARVW